MDIQVLTAENILVGEELTPLKKGYVVIKDGVIDSILSKDEFKKTPIQNHTLIDLGKKTLLPGMIECHTHVGLDARLPNHLEMMVNITECELTIMGLTSLKDDLMAGITTARSVGDANYLDITMQKKIKDKSVIGPNLIVSGVAIRGLHGFTYLGFPYTGVNEIRKKTRENLFKGVNLLKLFTTPGVPPVGQKFIPSYLSPEEIAVVVEDGNRVNIPTTAHCIGGQALTDCLNVGVEVIEHAYLATEQDVELFHKKDTWVDYTAGIFMDESREEFLSPQNVAKVQYHRDNVIKSYELMMKSNIKFSLGTDAYHGLLYREVEFAVQVGTTNKQALQGVTTNAAKVCRLEDKIGQLTKGFDADIIAVDENPLDNVSTLKNVSFVMKNGFIYLNK